MVCIRAVCVSINRITVEMERREIVESLLRKFYRKPFWYEYVWMRNRKDGEGNVICSTILLLSLKVWK